MTDSSSNAAAPVECRDLPLATRLWLVSRTGERPFERRVGLIAGAGLFPVRFAEAARARGHELVCLALRGLAHERLEQLATVFYEVGIARLGRMIRLLRRHRVRQLVLAGKVYKHELLSRWRVLRYWPDWRAVRLYLVRCRDNRKDDRMLEAVIEEFEQEGIVVRSALEICPELLVRPGVLTRREPTKAEWADIRFGWQLAREMGRLDVGQTVAVKECATLAVEAIEGTDRCIRRAGELCGLRKFVVVKVAKPQQDPRFDVPTVGPETIESMKAAGASALAIEAWRTILLEPERTIAAADEAGITIVAIDDPGQPLSCVPAPCS